MNAFNRWLFFTAPLRAPKGEAKMNTLAKLIIIFYVPALAMCSTAQSQDYVQGTTPGSYPSSVYSRAELDQLLAPIALYPDTVLSHVLIASTYPLEVVYAARWTRDHNDLDAEAAVAAVEHKDWDPSVRALVAFPQILQRMSDDLNWTQQLGDAFLADEALVMDAIQNLREKAYASGSLKKMKHVTVQREERVIIIEPAIERVVYIPYYDTRVVYGNWWWPHHPPTHWSHPRDHIYVGGFYWGPRAYLGVSFFSTSFHWHQHRVVYIDHGHHRHHSSRPYTSRKIVRHQAARHWQHNPTHRRGIDYRDERVRKRYGSHDRDNRHDRNASLVELRKQRAHDSKATDADRSARRFDAAAMGERKEPKRQFSDDRAARLRERLSSNNKGEEKRSFLGNDPIKPRDQGDGTERLDRVKRRDAIAERDSKMAPHQSELRRHTDLRERLSNSPRSAESPPARSQRRVDRSAEQKKADLRNPREQHREERERAQHRFSRREQADQREAPAQRREARRQDRVYSSPERDRSRIHSTRRENEGLGSRRVSDQIERR